jgi:hypothetical protein
MSSIFGNQTLIPLYAVNNDQVILRDGTVSVPSLRFSNALTSGLYHPASSQVAIATGGVRAALFTPTSQVLTGELQTGNVSAGNVNASSLITTPAFRLTTSPSSGAYLRSDSDGNATWQSGSGGASTEIHYRTSWTSVSNAAVATLRLFISIYNNIMIQVQGRMLISNIDANSIGVFRLGNQSLYNLPVANIAGLATDYTTVNTEYGILKYNWRLNGTEIELLLENTTGVSKFNLVSDFCVTGHV